MKSREPSRVCIHLAFREPVCLNGTDPAYTSVPNVPTITKQEGGGGGGKEEKRNRIT